MPISPPSVQTRHTRHSRTLVRSNSRPRIWRPTSGAISLSSSSHLPAMARSKFEKPVYVTGQAGQTHDKAAADRIKEIREHDRCRFSLPRRCFPGRRALATVTSGHRPINSYGVGLQTVLITSSEAKVDLNVAFVDPADLLKLKFECLESARGIKISSLKPPNEMPIRTHAQHPSAARARRGPCRHRRAHRAG